MEILGGDSTFKRWDPLSVRDLQVIGGMALKGTVGPWSFPLPLLLLPGQEVSGSALPCTSATMSCLATGLKETVYTDHELELAQTVSRNEPFCFLS